MDYTGKKLYIMCGTHWDREWYNTFQGFRFRLVSMLDRTMDYLEKTPEFPVYTLDGQTIVLEDYLEIRPERRQRLEQLIQAGRILIGPWYCMPDELLLSGESLIHNLLLGRRLCHSFGVEPWRFGYVCDIFGHTAQMPQIFAGFGIPYALLGRGVKPEPNTGFFRWVAPDGSECISYREDGHGYGWGGTVADGWAKESDPEKRDALIRENLEREFAKSDLPVYCFLAGRDHDAVRPELLEIKRRWEELYPGLEVVIGDLSQMGQELEAYRERMPFKHGEQLHPMEGTWDNMQLITNTLSSRYDLKQQNDRLQTLMEKWVQPLLLAGDWDHYVLPQTYADLAYKYLIQNHPHDSICGCSIDQVHRDMGYRFDQTREIGEQLVGALLGRWKEREGDPEGSAHLLTVYNPLPYAREETVTAALTFPEDYPTQYHELFGYGEEIASFRILDGEGRELPYNLLGIRHNAVEPQNAGAQLRGAQHLVSFRARLAPGGATRFRVEPSERPTRYPQGLATSPTSAGNGLVELSIAGDGTLTIADRRTGRTYSKLLTYLDDGEIGDGWYHCHPVENRVTTSAGAACRISLVNDGPAACTFRIETELQVPARMLRYTYRMPHYHRDPETATLTLRTDVTLDAGSPLVRVHTEVENRALDHRLRLALPTGIPGGRYFANEVFSFVERDCGWGEPERANYVEFPGCERAMSGIAGKRDAAGCGLAFLAAGGLHECAAPDTADGALLVTLLRCFNTTVGTNGEPAGELQGCWSFDYGLLPLEPTTGYGELQRLQDCLAAGVRTTFVRAGNAPAGSTSLLALEGDGDLCFSTAKRPEDGGDELILRLYHAGDGEANGALALPGNVERAQYVNLAEQPLAEAAFAGNRIPLRVGPWKIVTLRVRLAKERG